MDRRVIVISEIEIDASGRLLVKPAVSEARYSMIYRAGNGLRWDAAQKAFLASQPQRWDHSELIEHIVGTVRDECGDLLVADDATRWVNVSTPLQQQLKVACTRAGAADA